MRLTCDGNSGEVLQSMEYLPSGVTYNQRNYSMQPYRFCGKEIVKSDRLTIPHPLMHKRDFVLEPLAAIAPDAIHPLLGKSIGKLLEELLPSSINRRHCH